MASRDELYQALRNADAAGDAEGARKLASYIQSLPAEGGASVPASSKPEKGLIDSAIDYAKKDIAAIPQRAGNLVAGLVRGAGSIGSTILYPVDKATDLIKGDRGPNVTGLVTGKQPLSRNEERRLAIDEGLKSLGADPSSTSYQVGKIGAEVAGTAGVGGVLANGARAVGAAPSIVNALATSGMRAGTTPGAANMLTRMAGGGITGGASAGLVNPADTGAGAAIGAALPPALAGVGKVGAAIGQRLASPQVPESLRQSVAAAREAGYVIPPSQAKPTATNRLLEGFAGKITTAQNASAKNQPITNELAKRAIGAEELSPEALSKVRSAANAAYDELGKVGAFKVDDAFRQSLQKAGAVGSQMKKDFPELVNSEVESLVEGLSSRGEFDAQSAIEAIKQFRYNGSANKAAQDPAKKALGGAQMKIAGALEDLIDRNLQASGSQDLLSNYRAARQTLAKVYDVEKALNTASGNVDAAKLGSLLKKGRPLTGELRNIAEFANQFPKAAQLTERMGSLPQVSPLDFGALGAMSAATSNPLLMAGVLARPAARSAVLSNAVQNRLATAPTGSNRLMELLASPEAQQQIYRSAPVLMSSR